MTQLDTDLEALDAAMGSFFQAIKRPQHWARVTARAGVSLDRPAAHILHTLAAHPDTQCRVQDLAHQLGIEAPSVTRKTQELEQLGYLRRTPDLVDRRAMNLTVTARGRQISGQLMKAQRELTHRVLSSWNASDRALFVALFNKFSQDVGALITADQLPKPHRERMMHANRNY